MYKMIIDKYSNRIKYSLYFDHDELESVNYFLTIILAIATISLLTHRIYALQAVINAFAISSFLHSNSLSDRTQLSN